MSQLNRRSCTTSKTFGYFTSILSSRRFLINLFFTIKKILTFLPFVITTSQCVSLYTWSCLPQVCKSGKVTRHCTDENPSNEQKFFKSINIKCFVVIRQNVLNKENIIGVFSQDLYNFSTPFGHSKPRISDGLILCINVF